MNEDEFWPRLYKKFEHTDVDWERSLWAPDGEEGEIYVKFTNIRDSEGSENE